MEKLLLFPCNGNALEAVDCLAGDYELIGFVDDLKEKQGKQAFGYPVFSREILNEYPEAKVLAVPGSPDSFLNRARAIESLDLPTNRFATIIHPKATVSPLAEIGYNVLILAGVVITSNARIKNHVCILPNSVIHHDVVVEDYTLIGANVTVAGYTIIGRNCYVGSGSGIINGIEIGERSLIGLSANVIRTLPPNSKVVGNPARQIGEV